MKVGDRVLVTPHFEYKPGSFVGVISMVLTHCEYSFRVVMPNGIASYFNAEELSPIDENENETVH